MNRPFYVVRAYVSAFGGSIDVWSPGLGDRRQNPRWWPAVPSEGDQPESIIELT